MSVKNRNPKAETIVKGYYPEINVAVAMAQVATAIAVPVPNLVSQPRIAILERNMIIAEFDNTGEYHNQRQVLSS